MTMTARHARSAAQLSVGVRLVCQDALAVRLQTGLRRLPAKGMVASKGSLDDPWRRKHVCQQARQDVHDQGCEAIHTVVCYTFKQ